MFLLTVPIDLSMCERETPSHRDTSRPDCAARLNNRTLAALEIKIQALVPQLHVKLL